MPLAFKLWHEFQSPLSRPNKMESPEEMVAVTTLEMTFYVAEGHLHNAFEVQRRRCDGKGKSCSGGDGVSVHTCNEFLW